MDDVRPLVISSRVLDDNMANPLTIAIAALLVGLFVVQLALAWQYMRCSNRGDDEESFEKDVEWQLQHELDDAIEASSKATTPLSESNQVLLPSMNGKDLRLHYDNITVPAGSYMELRSQYRDDMDRRAGVQSSNLIENLGNVSLVRNTVAVHDKTQDLIDFDSGPMDGTKEKHIFAQDLMHINPKQLQRTLKRRLAREWLENYLSTRQIPTKRLRGRRQ